MSISSQIRQDIPQHIRRFPKLASGQPYYFHVWAKDRAGNECLYYSFKGSDRTAQYMKKVPLAELVAAIKSFQQKGAFDRLDFQKLCPIALSSGPCGFAVIGGYLEFRHKAKYKGRGKGFALK